MEFDFLLLGEILIKNTDFLSQPLDVNTHYSEPVSGPSSAGHHSDKAVGFSNSRSSGPSGHNPLDPVKTTVENCYHFN